MKPLKIITIFCILLPFSLLAQEKKKTRVEIGGYAMTDMGYNFNQVNPNYSDVMRPTQLPAYENQYGTDGNTYYGVRQTFFGIKTFTPTKYGDLMIHFAFDLMGLGPNEGRTAFHMLQAYAEIGKWSVGHNWSLFSDIGGYPNMVEYWGPVGLSLCKAVQLRFIPIQGENRLSFALEQPGASSDEGRYTDRIELDDVEERFKLPAFTTEFRMTRDWGYAEIAAVAKKMEWVDQDPEPFDLSGKAWGWGVNLSSNLNIGEKDKLIVQTIYGKGIQNLMNDAPTDVAIERNFGDRETPVQGVALPLFSYTVYLNHYWNEKFSSVLGYSSIHTYNTDGQNPDAFRDGQYASTNLLYHPTENITTGVELQWIKRKNYNDGWEATATKIQFSFRYSFNYNL